MRRWDWCDIMEVSKEIDVKDSDEFPSTALYLFDELVTPSTRRRKQA